MITLRSIYSPKDRPAARTGIYGFLIRTSNQEAGDVLRRRQIASAGGLFDGDSDRNGIGKVPELGIATPDVG